MTEVKCSLKLSNQGSNIYHLETIVHVSRLKSQGNQGDETITLGNLVTVGYGWHRWHHLPGSRTCLKPRATAFEPAMWIKHSRHHVVSTPPETPCHECKYVWYIMLD